MKGIDFNKKIKISRPQKSAITTLQQSLESDRSRIIHSAPIRRLQQKTQVFPLERNSAVRSRLTHSLEVQQIGRFIVQSIFENLNNNKILHIKLKPENFVLFERPIESLVEMACLMHDIGNPPFGHSGENAINHWFKNNISHLKPMISLSNLTNEKQINAIIHELCHFDGNAQAIRLIYSLHRFNLTHSQSASVLKYTRVGTQPENKIPTNKDYLAKKVGYFLTESLHVQTMMNEMEMKQYCRHPLSYIMEAADDISYCLADLEDAIEKNIFSLFQLTQYLKDAFNQIEPQNRPITKEKTFNELLDNVYDEACEDEISKTHQFFIKLRVAMIHPLVHHAAKQFTNNIEAVFHGRFNRALLEDNSQFDALTKSFKHVAKTHVFNHSEVETLELQGYKIIGGLLNEYKALLNMTKDDFQEIKTKKGYQFPIEQRLFNKLSNKHVAAYRLALKNPINKINPDLWEFYLRCRLLQDYISGMTDQFAFDEYKILTVC